MADEADQPPPPADDGATRLTPQPPQGTNAGGTPAAPPPSARELQVGYFLGLYRIEQKLGQGRMGAIYKAYEKALDRFVTIKVLSEKFSSDP